MLLRRKTAKSSKLGKAPQLWHGLPWHHLLGRLGKAGSCPHGTTYCPVQERPARALTAAQVNHEGEVRSTTGPGGIFEHVQH